jgi:hypothetical protein
MIARSPSVSRDFSPTDRAKGRVTEHARAVVQALQRRFFGRGFAVIGAVYAVLATTKSGDAPRQVSFWDFWKFIAKAGLVLLTMRLILTADRSRPSRATGDFLTALSCVAAVYFVFTCRSLYFASALGWAFAVAVFAHYRRSSGRG